MRDALFDLCRRFADAHVDSSGVAVTRFPVLLWCGPCIPVTCRRLSPPLVAMLLGA